MFRQHEQEIATEANDKGLKSDDVLAVLGPDLASIEFQVEASKKRADKLERPVFFGENGVPTLRYEIDAYHQEWKCGLEVEAIEFATNFIVVKDSGICLPLTTFCTLGYVK